MVSSAEHVKAYGELRAVLLSRHFAIRRYWRADLLSLGAALVGTDGKPPTRPVFGACRGRPGLLARWRVDSRDRGENPLMFGLCPSHFLSVEALFGHRESVHALRGYLHALGTLYLFTGDSFDGYRCWLESLDRRPTLAGHAPARRLPTARPRHAVRGYGASAQDAQGRPTVPQTSLILVVTRRYSSPEVELRRAFARR